MAATANIRQTSVADLVSMMGSSSTGIAPLILDTRSSTLYAENHILNAVCLSLPKVLLKRIQKGIAGSNLDELVVCDKDLLSRRKTGCAVVVYDDNGLLDDVTASAVLSVLINEGITPLYLQGGFESFFASHPQLCAGSAPIGAPSFTIQMPEVSSPTAELERLQSHQPFEAEASEILPYLIMSNERDAHNPAFIKAHGITHVLNLTPAAFQEDVKLMTKCYSIPLYDHTSQDISEYLPSAIAFINDARDTNGKVLVHCFAGISRSAAITIAYFLYTFDMTLDAAYNAVRAKRPGISPNLNFMGQLHKLEEILRTKKPALSELTAALTQPPELALHQLLLAKPALVKESPDTPYLNTSNLTVSSFSCL